METLILEINSDPENDTQLATKPIKFLNYIKFCLRLKLRYGVAVFHKIRDHCRALCARRCDLKCLFNNMVHGSIIFNIGDFKYGLKNLKSGFSGLYQN
jgi:hypothetical protein